MLLNDFFKPKERPNSDDIEIVNMLLNVKKELENVHRDFDYITDDMLIDSCIYEIKSLTMKYQYYIKLCKERGLIAEGFEKRIS